MQARPGRGLCLCASKHASHVCCVKGGCQRGDDRTKEQSRAVWRGHRLGRVRAPWKRLTGAPPPLAAAQGRHTFPGDMDWFRSFPRRVSVPHGTQTPLMRCTCGHLALPAARSVGSYPDFTGKAGAKAKSVLPGSGLEPGVREALGRRSCPPAVSPHHPAVRDGNLIDRASARA